MDYIKATQNNTYRGTSSGTSGTTTEERPLEPHPFTGYKMSGGGREHAQFGFDEITQIKVIAGEK